MELGTTPTIDWYKEIQNYRFNNSGFAENTGHFTQMVWGGSTKLGVGLAFSMDGNNAFIVAQYSPRGNIEGQFSANVLPRC